MISGLTESEIEEAALEWLIDLRYLSLHGSTIAPGEAAAERDSYGEVVLASRLRRSLQQLNPDLPAEALEEAFRKLVRPDAPSLVEQNRQLHRWLVEGVTLEHRRSDGSIAGAQARV